MVLYPLQLLLLNVINYLYYNYYALALTPLYFTFTVQHTTSCIAQSKTPEDGQNCCPKHVELNWIYQ